MEREENVYVDTTGAEELATAKEIAGREESDGKNALTVLGKFKDVDALARAYGSLQAEFTRRSQRLKELERAMDNLQSNQANGKEGTSESTVAVEKLRKNAFAMKAEEKKFDKFVAEIEAAGVRAELDTPSLDEEKPVAESVTPQAEALNGETQEVTAQSFSEGNSSVASVESAVLSSEELYEKASRDEGVRLKIIGEYLASLKRSDAPLMRGGGGTLAAPPLKAKTVKEAGSMALRFFQKDGKL